MESRSELLIEGLLLVIGALLSLGWKNMAKKISMLEDWRLSFTHEIDQRISSVEKDIVLLKNGRQLK